MFFSFWVLLGSSGVPSGVLLVFFWCSSGVLLVFFWLLVFEVGFGHFRILRPISHHAPRSRIRHNQGLTPPLAYTTKKLIVYKSHIDL